MFCLTRSKGSWEFRLTFSQFLFQKDFHGHSFYCNEQKHYKEDQCRKPGRKCPLRRPMNSAEEHRSNEREECYHICVMYDRLWIFCQSGKNRDPEKDSYYFFRTFTLFSRSIYTSIRLTILTHFLLILNPPPMYNLLPIF